MIDLITHFSKIKDQCNPNRLHYKQIDIIFIAIYGVICSADDWMMIKYFGNTKWEWFDSYLELLHGIPSHDIFGKVFLLIVLKAFQMSFPIWGHQTIEITRC